MKKKNVISWLGSLSLLAAVNAGAATVVVDFGEGDTVVDLGRPGSSYVEDGFTFTTVLGNVFIDTSPPNRDLLLNNHTSPRGSAQAMVVASRPPGL